MRWLLWCYSHVIQKGQKKNRLLVIWNPLTSNFCGFWWLLQFAFHPKKLNRTNAHKISSEYYRDNWSLLHAKITFWGFAWAFTGSVSSVSKAKAIEFLIDCIRKNPKYFARKFYKKDVSVEFDFLDEHYFVNVAFPPLIARERLVSLNVIVKIDNPTDAFSPYWVFSLRYTIFFVWRLPVSVEDFCTFDE